MVTLVPARSAVAASVLATPIGGMIRFSWHAPRALVHVADQLAGGFPPIRALAVCLEGGYDVVGEIGGEVLALTGASR